MGCYGTALPIVSGAAQAFRPPRRVTVAEGAAQSLKIVQPGGYTGFWSAAETPYMVEPMNTLASRKHEAVVFVGPARSGKTMGLLDGWMSHTITCDPGDMLIVQMTQDKARDYSKTRIDRAIRHSPDLSALLSARATDDNTHDKLFRHGMWLKIGWPSATQLASSDYRYVALTDYDRMPDNVDGEGSAYQLGLKRTTTFLSRGMCMVESSPGKPITDPNHRPATEHEAPPTGGILGIYNRGDRRRYYWPCVHCGEYFQVKPGLALFAGLPDELELLSAVRTADLSALATEHAVVFCPHCGCGIEPKHKQRMNDAGAWLRDGQQISRSGIKSDDGLQSSIASYWLGGAAAAYQGWQNLILRYLQALRGYATAGDEESLRVTVNTDQAMPYLPMALREEVRKRDLADMAEDFPRFVVPEQARFLIAAADVQGGQNARFVVQVHAFGPAMEQWLVDRYEITESDRPGVDGGKAPIDPASYPEDWDMLNQRVLASTYRTQIEGQELRPRLLVCDLGGEDGVSENAKKFWRSLRKQGQGSHIRLYKGGSSLSGPILKETRIGDENRKDVPQLLCNPNLLKDAVYNASRRATDGAARIHFPVWLGAAFWDEMRAEVREPTGRWKKVRKRNEAIDLCAMIWAGALYLGADRINWEKPAQPWARPILSNSERESADERRARKPAPARKPRRSSIGRSEWSERL
ncbi:phage terminase large subunit family protein [Marinobacter sp. CA1]|uniref:phage terminase large subunit family protein n=1 Tax=Marinobacter sp. CA1 TaxID=2817656 RepID=UPI001D090446|nr:terminase gpA endonuclease subunit [Marinobacter sp. CA1]UDL03990.1 phage terminase large subunit family protein [Marinobacter sp. CA1]